MRACSRSARAPASGLARRRRRGDGGVRRAPACEHAGVPAVEVRVVSNEIGEPDRALLALRRRVRGACRAAPAARRGSVLRVSKKPLPPPLPPETRTVGQLVAETVRLYGDRFWPSLALGAPVAGAATIIAALPGLFQLAAALTVGVAAVGFAYAAASFIAYDISADRRLYASCWGARDGARAPASVPGLRVRPTGRLVPRCARLGGSRSRGRATRCRSQPPAIGRTGARGLRARGRLVGDACDRRGSHVVRPLLLAARAGRSDRARRRLLLGSRAQSASAPRLAPLSTETRLPE